MDILDTLARLRDDLKSWVTLNLNALNSKIEENTIPIDNELNDTSTNPVQNKVISNKINALKNLVGSTSVAEQISTAISEQEHFSGNYSDLINAPQITDDESNSMVVVDKNDNVIFKVDNHGIYSTALFLNGENIANTLEQKVDAVAGKGLSTNDYTDADKAKLAMISSDSEAVSIDSQLSLTSENPLKNKVIAEKFQNIENLIDSKEHFSGRYEDLTNAPNITENNSKDVLFSDVSGNIIAKVDEDGVHAAKIILNGEDLSIKLNNEFNLINKTMQDYDRLRAGLIPMGMAIGEDADLNTIEYLSVGSYYCSANKTVATLNNCPTVHAFLMYVYSPISKSIDNETTSQWVYRIRKMLTYEGQEYIQVVYSGAVPGEFTYKAWEQSITTKELTNATQSMMSKAPISIELNQNGGLNDYGGFIDFHYHDINGNVTGNTDYSSRIIETGNGILKINNIAFDMNTRSMNAASIHVDNAETWTFVMDDGTTINKSVVTSA